MPIAGAVAFIVIAAAIAVGEIFLRRLARRPADAAPAASSRQPSMTASRAQRLYERALYVVAPSTVAGAIVLIRLENLPLGLFVAGTVAATTTLLWPGRFPLNLMPIARTLLRFALPILGVLIALLPRLIGGWDMTLEATGSAIIGTAIVVAFGLWLEAAFDADRPVRLAVIGSHELARKLATEMRQTEIRGYVVVGHIGPEPEPQEDRSPEDVLPTLGDMSEVRTIVTLFSIDLLAVGPDAPRLQIFEETANACLDLPVRMIEASAFYEDILGHVPIGQINSAWFQSIMHPRYSPTSPVSKRVFDLVIAVPLAAVTLVLLPFLALAVKLGGGGGVFYRQRRVGEQGREFDILKLRTMRPDAAELAGRVPKAELITPVGRFLRKTHLDELPQVLNVVRGDMTIVGPRPEQPQLVKELAEVVPYYERRSLVKPGVTGWAQLRCGYAGSKTGTAWKICHDLNYVKRRSIAFDLLIVLQTFQLFFARDAEDVEMEAPAEDFILGETASLIGR